MLFTMMMMFLLDAVKEIVKSKIYIHEVYTPFPVHGLDKAMEP